MKSYLSTDEVSALGLASCGSDVRISSSARIHGASGLHLGNHVRIDDYCVISASGGVYIGSHVHIAPFCGIYGGSGVEIGDFSGLSSRVALYSVSDDFSGFAMVGPMIPNRFRMVNSGRIVLGKHSVVGTNSTIMPSVKVDEGVAIGAHSLVKHDCDPWSIYSGVPAVKIASRSKRLLKLESVFLTTCGLSSDQSSNP